MNPDPFTQIANAILLGIHVEGCDEDNPLAPLVNSLTGEQVRWIAAWLAGEGFGRLPQNDD